MHVDTKHMEKYSINISYYYHYHYLLPFHPDSVACLGLMKSPQRLSLYHMIFFFPILLHICNEHTLVLRLKNHS